MQKVVFFAGVAGTGKTTVARKLAEQMKVVFLDRDTVCGRFVEKCLRMNGLDPNDRDSAFYREELRDLEYEVLRDVCLDNLKAGQDVFMISPFTSELANSDWIGCLLQDAGKDQADVAVKVVVVTLQNTGLQRRRIAGRRTERDNWKLEHWEEFESPERLLPEVKWPIPETAVHIFDNSGELTNDNLKMLYQFING